MDVKVRIATILLKKADPPLSSPRFTFSIESGADVEDLIRALGLPEALVGSVTVNSKRSPRDRVLGEGDRVAIIPSISGG